MAFYEQLLINGLVVGCVYALVSLGLTLVFGVLEITNFAHGEFYMVGGFFAYLAVSVVGMPFFLALLVAAFGGAVVAVLAERLFFRPRPGQLRTDTIITSFGLSVIMQSGALIIWGAQPKLIETATSRTIVRILDVYVSAQRLLIPLIAAVSISLLYAFLNYTWMGRSIRAMAQQPTVATIVGIDINRTAIWTFAIAGALAAGAGGLMGTIYTIQPSIGANVTLKAFTVVILGGMGSVNGVIAAGILLGVVESFAAGFIGNQWKDIVAFALVIAMLMFRPQGLFGTNTTRA